MAAHIGFGQALRGIEALAVVDAALGSPALLIGVEAARLALSPALSHKPAPAGMAPRTPDGPS